MILGVSVCTDMEFIIWSIVPLSIIYNFIGRVHFIKSFIINTADDPQLVEHKSRVEPEKNWLYLVMDQNQLLLDFNLLVGTVWPFGSAYLRFFLILLSFWSLLFLVIRVIKLAELPPVKGQTLVQILFIEFSPTV